LAEQLRMLQIVHKAICARIKHERTLTIKH